MVKDLRQSFILGFRGYLSFFLIPALTWDLYILPCRPYLLLDAMVKLDFEFVR